VTLVEVWLYTPRIAVLAKASMITKDRGVCLSLSAGQTGRAVFHPSPFFLPRVTPTARTPDWRFSLERGRTSRTAIGSRRIHTRYSFATLFVNPLQGRNPSAPLSLQTFSLLRPSRSTLLVSRCNSLFSRGAFTMHFTASAFTFRVGFLNKYFLNKYHECDSKRCNSAILHVFLQQKIGFSCSSRCQLFFLF